MPHGVGHGKNVSGSLNGISRKRMACAIELQRFGQSHQTSCLAELLGDGGQMPTCGFLGRKHPLRVPFGSRLERLDYPLAHRYPAPRLPALAIGVEIQTRVP